MIQLFRTLRCPADPSRPLFVNLAGPTSDVIWPQLQRVMEERFPHLASA